jgi:hypothetical protein
VLVIALLASISAAVIAKGFLSDFNGDLYQAGTAVLHGHDPYRPAFLAELAARKHAGHTVLPGFSLPVYPAPALLAAAPFALLPHTVSGILALVLLTAAMIGGLWLLGVRDWRCLGLALVSWPFVFGIDVGNLGPLIVLGAGVAWRWRNRLWPPAIAVASVVLAKLFPWPLLVWLAITRRLRVLALTTGLIAAAALVGWAAIGFAGFTDYPRMISDLGYVERGAGTSLVSALMAIGVPGGTAQVLALGAAALLFAYAFAGRDRPGGDARALGLAVLAALVCSPIVWPHYFVLLFVPIALASPSLSPVWFAPLLTVLAPEPIGIGQLSLWLAVTAVTGVALCRRRPAAATGSPERPGSAGPSWNRRGTGTEPSSMPAGWAGTLAGPPH